MRNIILLLTFLCCFPLTVFAQSKTFKPEANLGFKLGGTLSKVGFDPKIKQDLNFGFTGGLVFKHISQKSLGIQLEMNYLQVGWSENLDTTNVYSRRLDYLQIPFMTHACFGDGRVRAVLNIGPYLSFLVSDREIIELIDEEQEQAYYREDIGKRVDFGFCLGGGLIVNTSIGLFQVEGRVNYSLSNIFNNTAETPFELSQNQSVELTLSYLTDYKKVFGKKSRR